MNVERVNCGNFAINTMPDGSQILRNSDDNTVLALNPTAAAAWEACATANTVSGVAERMRRSLDPSVTDELAEAAIAELQEKKLVSISGRDSRPRAGNFWPGWVRLHFRWLYPSP